MVQSVAASAAAAIAGMDAVCHGGNLPWQPDEQDQKPVNCYELLTRDLGLKVDTPKPYGDYGTSDHPWLCITTARHRCRPGLNDVCDEVAKACEDLTKEVAARCLKDRAFRTVTTPTCVAHPVNPWDQQTEYEFYVFLHISKEEPERATPRLHSGVLRSGASRLRDRLTRSDR